MATAGKRSFKTTLGIIYALSVVLMIIRADWWWWGKKIEPLYAGWLSVPMLYQMGIWAAGTVLVLWLCLGVWKHQD